MPTWQTSRLAIHRCLPVLLPLRLVSEEGLTTALRPTPAALPVSRPRVTGRPELALAVMATVVSVLSATLVGSGAIVIVWLAFATTRVCVVVPE